MRQHFLFRLASIPIVIVLFLFSSCSGNNGKPTDPAVERGEKGTLNLSVDESFKPALLQELQVFEASYPQIHVNVAFKPEVECFRDLQGDKTDMVIVGRGMNSQERVFLKNKLSYVPTYDIVAYDAVALIVNIHSKDSIFTYRRIQNILSGKEQKLAVMDGKDATSIVKYLQDSVMHGKPLGNNLRGAASSEDVVETIKKNQNAVGFVGLGYVANSYEPRQIENLKSIRLALVECLHCGDAGYYAKASQETVTFGQYPLSRPLYAILKSNTTSVGSTFLSFISEKRGQLIFRRACLVPGKINFGTRQIQ